MVRSGLLAALRMGGGNARIGGTRTKKSQIRALITLS
jgi:hypothetical protein